MCITPQHFILHTIFYRLHEIFSAAKGMSVFQQSAISEQEQGKKAVTFLFPYEAYSLFQTFVFHFSAVDYNK